MADINQNPTDQIFSYERGNKFFYAGLIIFGIGGGLAWWNTTRFGIHKMFAYFSIAIMIIGFFLIAYGADKGNIFKR